MVEFLEEFEKAALAHDSEKLIELLDQEYRQNQLDGFHQGDTESFLNELFCGKDVKARGFECLKYNTIKQLNLVKVERITRQDIPLIVVGYTVSYRVTDGTYDVVCDWTVTVKGSRFQQTVYGIYGAVG